MFIATGGAASARRLRELFMKISYAILGAAALALSACGGKGDDTLSGAADNMDAAADNMSNETAADAMEEKADATREAGAEKEEAIDEADANATR